MQMAKCSPAETNKQGCYISVELYLAFRDQPKISVNHSIVSARKAFFRSCVCKSGLIRASHGIYLLICLRLESVRKQPRCNKFKGGNHGQSSGSGRDVWAFSPRAVKQK